MIVAMSRFRVLHSREQDVRQAFLNRPGLVDDRAGFMGLEVFQDHSDYAVFYLVTRWSDVSSFKSWHASHEHKASHEMMPKGLKLDSAFTELRILDRVEAERDQNPFEHFGGDWGALTRAHLTSSTISYGIVATSDGSILGASAGMESLLSNEPLLTSGPLLSSARGKLAGQPLWRFLTAESAQELRSRLATGSRAASLRFLMTFVVSESREHLVICNLDVQPNAFALLCESVAAAGPESRPTK
jgi:heme oxygenase (mycobilin-producing)